MLLALAALTAVCRPPPPTPAHVAACQARADVTQAARPKVRSLHLGLEVLNVHGCEACRYLLRDRDLDFVELRRLGDPSPLVDRVRLGPSRSADCAAPPRDPAQPPYRLQFRTPRGRCLVIEEKQAPSAEAMLVERVGEIEASYSEKVREVVARDGTPFARITDFRRNFAEVRPLNCADVLNGFPRDTYDWLIDQVTAERRR